jgi:hypothetical protein
MDGVLRHICHARIRRQLDVELLDGSVAWRHLAANRLAADLRVRKAHVGNLAGETEDIQRVDALPVPVAGVHAHTARCYRQLVQKILLLQQLLETIHDRNQSLLFRLN